MYLAMMHAYNGMPVTTEGARLLLAEAAHGPEVAQRRQAAATVKRTLTVLKQPAPSAAGAGDSDEEPAPKHRSRGWANSKGSHHRRGGFQGRCSKCHWVGHKVAACPMKSVQGGGAGKKIKKEDSAP